MSADRMTDRHVDSNDRHGRAILTVGALRELLAHVPADTHVVMDDGNYWWNNIGCVIVPAENYETAEYQCVTLVPGDAYDGRQS